MQLVGQYVQKKDVQFCTEDYTLQQALNKLNETGYRCIPVLDRKGKHFLGNIYKTDILESEKSRRLDESVTDLMEDSNEFINEHASFFKVFFTIKKLPYIAVVGDENEFLGILTHAKVLEILEGSWGVKSGKYTLTIGTLEYNGALLQIVTVLNKYTAIQSLITLDNDSHYARRIIATLPSTVTEEQLTQIKHDLEEKGFRIIDIESPGLNEKVS